MRESLLKNELRPYDYIRTPGPEGGANSALRNFTPNGGGAESLRVRSVSPYRATIQVDSSSPQLCPAQPNTNGSEDAESNEEEGDFERDGTLTQHTEVNQSISPMTAYK